MRRVVPILLLLALFAPFLRQTEAQTSGEPASLPGQFMGMVVRDPHYEWKTNPKFPDGVNQTFYDEMGRNLAAAGVKWVRMEFFSDIKADGTDRPGRVNVRKYHYFINVVAPRHGLKVLGLLATPLVRRPVDDVRFTRYPNGEEIDYGEYIDPAELERPLDENPNETDPENRNPVCHSSYGWANPYMCIWLRNALDVASAFPYDPETGTGVAAFEILNEQNRYIGGDGKGLAPESVAILMAKFYRLFKIDGRSNPRFGPWVNNVQVILGGLHPARCVDCGSDGMSDRQYLHAIYRGPDGESSADGVFEQFRNSFGRYPLDGVGYHPYPLEMQWDLLPEDSGFDELYRVPGRMEAIREIMFAAGDRNNKIWVTEIGEKGTPIDDDNLARQANFMRIAYRMLWEQREYIAHVFWFKYEDFAVPNDDTAVGPANFGIVRLERCAPARERPSCTYEVGDDLLKYEYAVDGAVKVYKPSYHLFSMMAKCGIALEGCYKVHLPLVGGE